MKFFLIPALTLLSTLSATPKISYESQNKRTKEEAIAHSQIDDTSLSRYITYRDIPALLKKHLKGKKVLDYGCGDGFSTAFLKKQGLNVLGVDISKEMLTIAREENPTIPFLLVKKGHVPVKSNLYDAVFSSLVLFELEPEKEMLNYLKEAKRLMKNNGVFIALTGSEVLYNKNWLLYNVDYPENKNLKSGDLAKVHLIDANIEFTNYYWTEADYKHFFEQAGLELLEIHHPKGKASEPYRWKDEKNFSPFVIFIAKKQIDTDPNT